MNDFLPTRDLVLVGAGAAGVEVSLCLEAMLSRRGVAAKITLLDAGERILDGYLDRLVELAEQELSEREIEYRPKTRVRGYEDGRLRLDEGPTLESDLVIWATGAAPPPALDGFDLPKSDDGFLAVDRTLRSTGGAPVFVVGDTATLVHHPVPKAGVYAVREGKILFENLRRVFDGRPLVEYEPQSGFLSLLALGDGRAVGQYKGRAFLGEWVWELKDFIDRRFMRKHQEVEPMTEEMMEKRAARDAAARKDGDERPAMRCRGCGGKVGASILEDALASLDVPASPYVAQGLDAPDDAAVLAKDVGAPEVLSVDFFQSFLDDPWIVGRVAANNALSDLFATGADPIGAMAMVTLPEASRKQQTEMLRHLLAGGLRELAAAGATLLGGHTTEGAETTIGYTVIGRLGDAKPFTKGSLRAGDRLVLTKPLGTGVLLAGLPLCRTRAPWIEAALASMLASNRAAAALARELDLTAVTDVTGFGLGGHLLEMLDASGVTARLDLDALPLLPGFESLATGGVRSSLDPSNREIESRIDVARPTDRSTARYAALFDPQTSGGLLLAIPADKVTDGLRRLEGAGYADAAVVAEVVEASDEPTIRIG